MHLPGRAGITRPPIGAAWGWVQTVAGRRATDCLVPGGALVLAPHPDDETIGCGLLMAEKATRGIPVAVAVATDGRHGWYSPTPRPASCDIAEIRSREWNRALGLLGVPPADRFEFGFPDGELSDHESELADRIGQLLRRVRPSQVYVTRSGDPHADHRTLAETVRNVVAQIYDSDAGRDGVTPESRTSSIGPRPRIFSYRVYPGEGLWPEGRPDRVTLGSASNRFVRSVLGLASRRALLLRAPRSTAAKIAAVNAYDSQSKLLGGELRYVWSTDVELYWPMEGHGPREAHDPSEHST